VNQISDYQRGIAEGIKRERARWLANYKLSVELHVESDQEHSKFGSPELQTRIIAHALGRERAAPASASAEPDYIGFALDILTQSRDHLGCDIDGGTLQESAARHGLLIEVQAQAPCGEACQCAEFNGLCGNPPRSGGGWIARTAEPSLGFSRAFSALQYISG
jgi:hypothetical protein